MNRFKSRAFLASCLALVGLALVASVNANAADLMQVVTSAPDLFAGLGAAGTGATGLGLSALGMAGMGSIAPVENHATTKFFRIAVEGATTDGRAISRDWIEQMAKNYDPEVYGARINLEHFRGLLPDSPFKAYGDVLALESREETGKLAGKLGLYAQLAPTADLVALNKAKQKIYTSCEVNPEFADTGEAYLVGLAITDSPASLGTTVLSFAAQNPAASPFAAKKQDAGNLFTAAEHDLVLELEQSTNPAPGVSLFKKVSELLGKFTGKAATDDERFADVAQAVEAVANHATSQDKTVAQLNAQVTAQASQIESLTAAAEKDRAAHADLLAKLSITPNPAQQQRPPATGGTGAVTTDC